ncbi:hypothetical protein [Bradyrhizobium guangdongense]
MLTSLKDQVSGFIVCEGEVIDATLIAVDFTDVEPLVTLADIGGATLLYMADIFYTDREVAERDAEKECGHDDMCEECAAKERLDALFDNAAQAKSASLN